MNNFKQGKLLLCSLIALVFGCFANAAVYAQGFTITNPSGPNTPDFVEGELIVKLKPDSSIEDIKKLNEQYQVYSVENLFKDILTPEESLVKVKKELEQLLTEHESWYWQLDKNSKEYLEYQVKLDKKKVEIEDRVKTLEALIAKNEARKKRAPKDVAAPDLQKTYILKTSKDTNLNKMILDYKHNAAVVYAEPNYIVKISAVPTEDISSFWYLNKIQAKQAWNLSQGENVVVAVVDTGVDYTHKELSSKMWVNKSEIANNGKDDDNNGLIDDYRGWDCVNWDKDPMDDNIHGTHCAGVIGAAGNNGGLVGVAPKALIMPVKGLSGQGAGSINSLTNAVRYSLVMGADVISCSWGSVGSSSTFKSVMDLAVSQGCIVVVAAGNDNIDTYNDSPANVPSVIAVAATDSNDRKASFSNYGAKVDVAAPGVGIYSTVPGNGYRSLEGTSMACPQVSGVVALILAKQPTFNNEKIRGILRSSVDPISTSVAIGTGRINAFKAVNNSTVSPATAKITSPKTNATVSGIVDVLGNTSANYELFYGQGASPASWTRISSGGIVNNTSLGKFSTANLTSQQYSIELRVGTLTDRILVNVDNNIMSGFPINVATNYFWSSAIVDNIDSTPGLELIVMDVGSSYNLYCYGVSAAGVSLKWKQSINRTTGVAYTPLVFDLNKDGNKEVIVGGSVFTAGGVNLGGNWPLTADKLGITDVVGVAVGDFNADNKNEIAFLETTLTETSQVHLLVYDSTGNKIAINFSSDSCVGISQLGLTAVDLDNNGKKELYFSVYKANKTTIYKYDFSTNLLTTAADTTSELGQYGAGFSRAAVADIGSNNQTEIVFPGNSKNIYILGKSGIVNTINYSMESYWGNSGLSLAKIDSDDLVDIIHGTQNGAEVYFGNGTRKLLPLSGDIMMRGFTDGYGELANGIAAADLNNDKRAEIFFASHGVGIDGIHGYTWNGSDFVSLSGFPKRGILSMGTPVIADIDGDNVVELIVTSFTANVGGTVYAWKLNTPASSLKAEWPMFRHDSSQTSVYNLGTGVSNNLPVAIAQTVTTTKDLAVSIKLSATDADNDPLTYTVVTKTVSGVLTGTAPNLVYTPNTGFVGTDSLIFRANDGKANSSPATVTIKVNAPANTPPVAIAQTVTITTNTAVSIILKATDVDNDTLTYGLVSRPASGVLTGTAPNLVYTSNANFVGTDSFTFKANDGKADSSPATVTIKVTAAANNPPVAIGQTVTTRRDLAVKIVLTATDADNDNLIYSVIANPISGVLSGTAPNLVYTPNTNFVGTDSFTFRANDGKADSSPATVMITVTAPANTPPVAIAQTVTTNKDTAAIIKLSATDADNDALTYALVTRTASGVLSGTVPDLVYTPNAGFVGTDSFTFRANDGKADSSPATVTIKVEETVKVNNPPVADSKNLTLKKNISLNITKNMTATDLDNDPLTYSIVANPTNGKLTKVAPCAGCNPSMGDFYYTPNKDFIGQDIITYRANDGKENSNTAVITINVANLANIAPVAESKTLNIDINTGIFLKEHVKATDADGDPLVISVVDGPKNGKLESLIVGCSGFCLTYVPTKEFVGTDTFTFIANDGNANSNVATITINVANPNSANHPPVAQAKTVTTQMDKQVDVVLTATDADNDPLTLDIVTMPANGKIFILYGPNRSMQINTNSVQVLASMPNNQFVIYIPNKGFSGTDTFTFKANDKKADSNPATITIIVENTQGNRAPVALSKTVSTSVDTQVEVVLTATDADNDPLTFRAINMPSNGKLFVLYSSSASVNSLNALSSNSIIAFSTANKSLIYIPNSGFAGTDAFTFLANDGKADSNLAVITINVNKNQNNHYPVAQSKSITTAKNQSIDVVLTATDADNDPITYKIITNVRSGVISGTAPNLIYTPNQDFVGLDYLVFQANDGKDDSNTGVILITVVAANIAPVANSQTLSTQKDAALNITLTATDADKDALSLSIVNNPANGRLIVSNSQNSRVSGINPLVNYTPNLGFVGTDTFTFKANDGKADSNTGIVTINVTDSINHPPVSLSQTVTTEVGTPIKITLTARDIDGDTVTFKINQNPAHGTVSMTAGSNLCVYTPEANFSGLDSFKFQANDGKADSNASIVSIDVKKSTPSNLPPVIKPINDIVVSVGAIASFKVEATDPEGSKITFKAYSLPQGATFAVNTGAFSWLARKKGNYVVYFEAIDVEGAVSEKIAVKITASENVTYNIPVLIVKYFPLDGSGNIDKNYTGPCDWLGSNWNVLSTVKSSVDSMTGQVITALQEGSRYHGYKDSTAKPSLSYTVVDTIEFSKAMPELLNSTSGASYDYNKIMAEINAQDWVMNKGIKEIWIWGYHKPGTNLNESNMSGPYGDVSNSWRTTSDLPVFGKTYTVYHYNYTREASMAVEDHTHQIEALMDNRNKDFFWNVFVGPNGVGSNSKRVGWTHYPPNATTDYDWANSRYVETDIEDWKPDGTGAKKSINADRWNKNDMQWKIFWMQNIPGANNGLINSGKALTNWWVFVGDFDNAIKDNITLFEK